ncbi:TIGR02647 family protein [Reinekea marina]|uniref:TIGR02647 family protein n=1 Tax=Reinekea marina TaxID=1310421 RepID=A0ABV7WW30_9GAMM|nr:TIGR02647 family protein [Reinekea marina]MBU2862715.1 TIGR02647 family protein [Reinekea forsetii]MDN3648951.1 TIGR02647 family protein [Reinekea marina]
MSLSAEKLDEINLLLQFPSDTIMAGLKIHSDAESNVQQAAKRLYEKGFTDSPDGGYLTDAGIEILNHIKLLNSALK